MIRRLNRLMVGMVVVTFGIGGLLAVWFGLAIGLAHLAARGEGFQMVDPNSAMWGSAFLMGYAALCYPVGKWMIGRYRWTGWWVGCETKTRMERVSDP